MKLRSTTQAEPSRRDLRAIEAEWPRIAATLTETDAEIAQALAADKEASEPELGEAA